VGEPVKFNVGHFTLGKDSGGWAFEEQTNENGAVHVYASGLTTSEMALFLRGYISGVCEHARTIERMGVN
jgi:hypothetical protein